MILHVSVTADHPRSTAETLATLLGGRAIPLGPNEGSWTAVGPDPVGNVIEVMERGSEFHRAGSQVETLKGDPQRHSGFHLLMESPMSEQEILTLAEETGTSAYRASRGIFGDLIEFWIDDCLLVEVLPLAWSRAYRSLLTSGELQSQIEARLSNVA
jgi:hypothetical protein